jgi:N-acetylmuramate 1-kinase
LHVCGRSGERDARGVVAGSQLDPDHERDAGALQPPTRRLDAGIAAQVLLHCIRDERQHPGLVLRQASSFHTLVNLAWDASISAHNSAPGGGSVYHHTVRTHEIARVSGAVAALGLAPGSIRPLAGDASRRSFYRVVTAGASVVAAVYPEGAEEQLARDERVHAWGWEHGLPIPRPLGHTALVALSSDLGGEDLERAMRRQGEDVLAGVFEALAQFQTCGWEGLETPPFDAAFFRRELAGFEEHAGTPAGAAGGAIAEFLNALATRLGAHPYRLAHRDFHVNNLFLHHGSVWAVDYQDMRAGPDTYDAASLLRERAGGEMLASDTDWCARAAARLEWQAGWEERYLECAAQRGLKVVGTFLRLAAGGRAEYLEWLPRVAELTRDAVIRLDPPGALADRLGRVSQGL